MIFTDIKIHLPRYLYPGLFSVTIIQFYFRLGFQLLNCFLFAAVYPRY